MARLPLVAELGNRALLAVGHEHRIESEPLGAAGPVRDSPAEGAGAAQLFPVRTDRDELRHVARAPALVFDTIERAEQPAHLVAGGAARRGHSGPAAEPVDLDAGVLTEHPGLGRRAPAREERLAPGVLVVRRAP